MDTQRMLHQNETSQELILEKHVHPVLADYPHAILISILYLVFVRYLGPQLMKDRQPMVLDSVIRVYNVVQVVMNLAIIYCICLATGFRILEPLRVCNVVSSNIEDKSEAKIRVLQCLYYYYINKIIDLFDTVFFILKKKQSQVTFLHVYHHVLMIGSTWISTMVLRGENLQGFYMNTSPYYLCLWFSSVYAWTWLSNDEILMSFAALNALVHAFMYTYYFLSSLGPAIQKYLWWKKYITSLQIAQFLLALVMLLKLRFSNCEHTSGLVYLWTFNLITLLMLFLNFYVKSYSNKKKVK